jgi:integrase
MDALARQWTDQEELRLVAQEHGLWRDTGLVFTSSYGTVLDPSAGRKRFKALVKAAGIRGDWHPHQLRHSAVSLLSMQKVPPEQIMDIMGHSNMDITIEVYRHVNPTDHDEGKRAMEALFGEGSTS